MKPIYFMNQVSSMQAFSWVILGMMTVFLTLTPAHSAIDVYEFDTPAQEAQYRGLIDEFRCPKCQNQNLAGSDSQISQDLKRKTYEMVMAGQNDAQIRDYMYERYGDFISYKPPIRPSTYILWFFPPIFLFCILAWWVWRNKRKSVSVKNLDSGRGVVEMDKHEALSEKEAQKLKHLLSDYSSSD